jgi:imidazolonepropionase-like amidohydrolase
LDGVTLIDGRGGPPVPDRFLLIRSGQIVAIGRSGTAKVGKGVTRLDLSGRYVIPGLIDSHVHLKSRPRDPGMMEMILKSVLLRSGVTTVRDMGGNGAELAPLARSTQGSNAPMPEILLSSLVTGARSPFWIGDDRAAYISAGAEPGTQPWFRRLSTVAQAEEVARQARAWGASGLKVHSGFDRDQLVAIGAAARRHGLALWTHAAVGEARPSDAVAAGARTLSHADQIAYEGLEAIPSGFNKLNYIERTRVAMAATPVEGEAVGRLLARMKAKGTCLEPTLFVMTPAGPAAQTDPYSQYAAAVSARAHKAGVPICAGTDAIGGSTANLPEELALLVNRAGLTPLQAIAAATFNNARALGLSDRGLLAPGRRADVVVLSRDPSRDIANIKSVEAVIQRGVLHRPAAATGN